MFCLSSSESLKPSHLLANLLTDSLVWLQAGVFKRYSYTWYHGNEHKISLGIKEEIDECSIDYKHQSKKQSVTLHSDAATTPKHPMGSAFAPLVRKKSRASKLVTCHAFAFSLQSNKEH